MCLIMFREAAAFNRRSRGPWGAPQTGVGNIDAEDFSVVMPG